MKVNIECNSLSVNNSLSFEENGLIGLLEKYNNCGIVDLNTIIGTNDSRKAISIIKTLVNKQVFDIKETNENDSLVINLINGTNPKSIKLDGISRNKKIQLAFQLNEAKYQGIIERSTDKKSFRFNLINICFENYHERKLPITEVNSEEEFIEMMYAVTPFETILSNGNRLTRRDFEQIYDIILEYDFDLALINFAIDYSINTSNFHNLSYDFVRILLDSWKKHKVTDVKLAIKLIHAQKEAGSRHGSKYVSPEYEQPEISNEEPKSIKKLFAEDDNFE